MEEILDCYHTLKNRLLESKLLGLQVKRGIEVAWWGATLFMKDLERNGVATEDELYNITYYGKGRMPGFGEKCTPRGQCTFGPRLAEDDIKLLAAFVKSQAENGWPKIDRDGD
uniref:Cytochrome c-553 n=1 Tax=Oryza brachyantha TaxID=4533 RepID=J3MM51_ORYBR